MRLPLFLKFLEPKLRKRDFTFELDGFKLVGHVKVERQIAGGPRELVHDSENFIVDAGLTGVRDILIGPNGAGFTGSIFRMAVGDAGAPSGDLFNPKLPDGTWPARTALFHEVFRKDITVFSEPTAFAAQFVGAFDSVDVDPTSYSISDKVINEASLIIGDGVLTVGDDPKQINKVPPDTADADELLFSTRTFNSVSFDPTDDVTVTITWTITVSN